MGGKSDLTVKYNFLLPFEKFEFNLGFIILNMAIVYFGSVAEIKKNWPLYRCNPMYMWLSDDIDKDFTGCIQTMQSDFMPDLLEPLNYIVSQLSPIKRQSG